MKLVVYMFHFHHSAFLVIWATNYEYRAFTGREALSQYTAFLLNSKFFDLCETLACELEHSREVKPQLSTPAALSI